jgi:WD40 repeat protein
MSRARAAGLFAAWLILSPAGPAGGQPPRPRTDLFGDPLPAGALARLGTVRWRTGATFYVCSTLAQDGRTLFVGGGDRGTIRLFNLETGACLRTISGHEGGVASLALSPDGKLLASGGYKDIHLWDAPTGRHLRRLRSGAVRTLAFSPDGTRLISGGQDHDRTVRVFDVKTGKEMLRTLWHQREVSYVGCAPDGKTLVTASSMEGTVHFADLTTGEVIRTIHPQNAHDTVVALSPDGKTLAVADMRYQNQQPNWVHATRLLDLATGKELRTLGGPGSRTTDLAFSPDGKLLVSSGEKALHLWDVSTGREKGRLPGTGTHLRFTPDGRRMVAAGSIIRVWDVVNGKELHPPEGHLGYVSSVAYSPDGRTLATCSYDQHSGICLWETATSKLRRTLPGHEIYNRSVAFTPDGKLVSGGGDSTLRVWDPGTGQEVFRFKLHEPRAGEKPLQVLSMSVSRDGRSVSAACMGFEGRMQEDEQLFVWNLRNRKLLAHVAEKQRFFTDFPAFSPDGKLVVQSEGGDLVVKDLGSGKEVRRLRPAGSAEGPKGTGAVILQGPSVFSPDGKTLATRSSRPRQDGLRVWRDNYAIRLFDLATGREQHHIPVEGWQQALTFSPDGQRLAAVGDRAIRIWDVHTGTERWRSPVLDSRPGSLAFSPDGTRLASGMDNTTILIWDVGPGK